MGRKSRYAGYAGAMKRATGDKKTPVPIKTSIKNRIAAMKAKSGKGVK